MNLTVQEIERILEWYQDSYAYGQLTHDDDDDALHDKLLGQRNIEAVRTPSSEVYCVQERNS